jgi:hypothetical protein
VIDLDEIERAELATIALRPSDEIVIASSPPTTVQRLCAEVRRLLRESELARKHRDADRDEQDLELRAAQSARAALVRRCEAMVSALRAEAERAEEAVAAATISRSDRFSEADVLRRFAEILRRIAALRDETTTRVAEVTDDRLIKSTTIETTPSGTVITTLHLTDEAQRGLTVTHPMGTRADFLHMGPTLLDERDALAAEVERLRALLGREDGEPCGAFADVPHEGLRQRLVLVDSYAAGLQARDPASARTLRSICQRGEP